MRPMTCSDEKALTPTSKVPTRRLTSVAWLPNQNEDGTGYYNFIGRQQPWQQQSSELPTTFGTLEAKLCEINCLVLTSNPWPRRSWIWRNCYKCILLDYGDSLLFLSANLKILQKIIYAAIKCCLCETKLFPSESNCPKFLGIHVNSFLGSIYFKKIHPTIN